MTLYVDVIWFLNLCINYLLIALTAIVLKRPFHHFRFIGAALFASMIIVFMFTPYAYLFSQIWLKALYSAIIVWIAFGFKRTSYFFQGLFMFYFVSFMTGGGLFAMHFFWQTELPFYHALPFSHSVSFGTGVSWIFVMIGFPLVWYFSKKRFETIEYKQIQYEQIVNVEIGIDGMTVQVNGLIDSGNQLQDPITKTPVMIMNVQLLNPIFSEKDIIQILNVESFGMEQVLDERLLHRLKLVPYRVVGQSQRFLSAIKPDYVKITYKDEVHEIQKVLVGLNEKELSPEGVYDCIIHPKMLLQSKKVKLA